MYQMDLESAALLRRIKEHEIQELVITKSFASLASSNLQGLVAALRVNTSIRSCSVILRFLDPQEIPCEGQAEFLHAIASIISLEDFRMVTTSTGFTDSVLQLLIVVVSRCTNLSKLTLQTVSFQRTGLASDLHYNSCTMAVLSELFEALSKQNNLETLSLDGIDGQFDLCGIMTILTFMPSVQHVFVKAQTVAHFYHPEAMKDFLHQSQGIATLSIERFLLADHLLGPYFSTLASNATLVDLRLDEVGMISEVCDLLAQSLTQNSTLTHLSLVYNGITDAAGCTLISSLKKNTRLRALKLDGNFLSVRSCRALADLLEDPSSRSELTNLSLAQNILIRDEGSRILASTLAFDKRITHLNLSKIRLTHVTSALLGTTLASNSTLQRLNLSRNSLGEAGATHLANLLRVNQSIQHLNLAGTKIGQRGSVALSKALTKEDGTLISLNLGGNSMILCPKYMERMVMINCTLMHLWLPSHLLSNDSLISSFLRLNKFGRRQLLQERNNSVLWKAALVEFATDHRVSYYLLRMNPAILSWI